MQLIKLLVNSWSLFQVFGNFMHHESYMLASAGQPSLHGYAYVIYWAKGALRRNRRQKYCKTSFFLSGFSVESEFDSTFLGSGYLASLDWAGPAPWATPS